MVTENMIKNIYVERLCRIEPLLAQVSTKLPDLQIKLNYYFLLYNQELFFMQVFP